ncbi:NB-ARC domain-containing protein, partial [Streptomyces sp. GC420]|uniref:NB-ARC domain-containing protein n=1 Tax=Streptomyces sp. GC420 TaxID=2697568 RepID=UPI001414E7ED|nr:AAA family ATPase [Streptomyces sp. GC420]
MTEQAVNAAEGLNPGQFLGRRRELKELLTDIERAGLDTIAGRKAPRARVLLIAGRPGSGRTALAGRLAREVGEHYPDGVLYARLTVPGGEPVTTDRTARELLDTLGIQAPPGAGEDELSEALRTALAGRRVLLILDDAADAAQVDPLIPDNPDCLVVATSRGPLTGIPDVRPCTLGGLDAISAVHLLSSFTGSVRVTVDPTAAETLAEECAGRPAALILVGGWLRARPQASVAEVTKRLSELRAEDEAAAASGRRTGASHPGTSGPVAGLGTVPGWRGRPAGGPVRDAGPSRVPAGSGRGGGEG